MKNRIYVQTPWRSRIDQKLSQRWGYVAERLFLDDEEVKNSPKQMFGEYGAGDIKYKDINGDMKIDENDKYLSAILQPLKSFTASD